MKQTMRFSWKALLLAPLPIPLAISVWFATSGLGSSPNLSAFLFFFVIGCVLSYGTTIFLFLPCLLLTSRLTSLTVHVTGLVGAVLGCLVSLAVSWQFYLTSGVDSGPPKGTFGDYPASTDWSGTSGCCYRRGC